MRLPLSLALALTIVFGASSAEQVRSPDLDRVVAPAARPPVPPELPRVRIDTSAPSMAGRAWPVASSRDLRAALDAASGGDTIVLQSGVVYRGPFTLSSKPGSAWIVVTTDAPSSSLPTPGSRIDPSYADRMPTLTATSSPVLIIPSGVRGYRFVGIEIRPEAGTFLTALVSIGGTPPPGDIVFDRCYLHGDPRVGGRRGIALNGGATAVINSYLSDFKEVGADSQAIAGWDGPGPFAIINNHLEAAGENVLFGGADPSTPNLVPSDIEIRHNHMIKSLTWKSDDRTYAGTPWTVKNLFELKNARRVLIDGNILEYNWPQAQNGFAILFTVRNQDGGAPWSSVEDVRFTNNVVRHVAAGVNMLGRDDNHPSGPTQRVLIQNNLFDDVGGIWTSGRLFQMLSGTSDVVIDHNTASQTDSFLIGGDTLPHPRFVFRNNIVLHNLYGLIGSDSGIGLPSLDRYFPDALFRRNAIVGGDALRYPPDNFFPASFDAVKFVDWRAQGYGLQDSSALRRAGTDGTDIGVDVAALTSAAGGADRQQARPAGDKRPPTRPSGHLSDGDSPTRQAGAHAAFWAAALLLAYTYVGYPLLITAWARLRPQRSRRRRIAPAVSVLVIAHNEGDAIAAKIENLLSLDYPADRLEIVIASDGSTDDTAAIARAYEREGVRVLGFTRRRGKPAVLNDVLAHLAGEIVVLADARQRIEAGALWAIVAAFADPSVGAVSGELMLNDAASPTLGRGVGWYWRYEKLIRQSESAVDSTIGATGAVYAIRRALFEPIPEDTILDDVLIPLRIVRRGYRVLFEPGARAFDGVVATARRELARKVRTSAGNFQLLARERWVFDPLNNRLWFQTLSHKGLRLCLPLLHLAALTASLNLASSWSFYRWALDAQTLFYAFAIGGLVLRGRRGRVARLLAVPYVICLLSWSIVLGFVRFLRGLQPTTWEPTHVAQTAPRRVLPRH
ncbi:MAG: glycosyltransferase [Acidobacteria bacterium]|nr:glycosyltransferase [Acidobacteriota bacterium]